LLYASVSCCFLTVSFFFSSRRRHTRSKRDWSSDVCSSDLTSAHQDYIEESFTDGFAVVEEAVIGKVDPTISTERESEFIDDVDEIGRASCRERGWSSEGAVVRQGRGM